MKQTKNVIIPGFVRIHPAAGRIVTSILKMDLVDLVYGWARVAEHIASTGGNIDSYIQHMKFTAELLHSRKFFDESAVSYDRHIIDRFVDGKSSDFNPDPIGASLYFSPNVIPKDCEPVHGGSLHKSVIGAHDNQRRFRFRQGGRAAYSNRPRSEEKPADSDLAYTCSNPHGRVVLPVRLTTTQIKYCPGHRPLQFLYLVHPQVLYEDRLVPEYNRKAFTRLRLSSHKLKIETGRWSRIPKEARRCP